MREARTCRARRRWVCDKSTCSNVGRCMGASAPVPPKSSQSSKAVRCSVKKGEGEAAPVGYSGWLFRGSASGPPRCWYAMWKMHDSAARSHVCHKGCVDESGSGGQDCGVQLRLFMRRLANEKLRNNEATRRSSRNSFWKTLDGNVFHAIVSVIAVKIQCSSPLGVLRSEWSPGMFSDSSRGMSPMLCGFCSISHRNAMGMGVVRHDVNTSAGYCGLMGRISLARQAARTMVWLSTPACGMYWGVYGGNGDGGCEGGCGGTGGDDVLALV